MNRISCVIIIVATIIAGAIAQTSDDDKNELLDEFLQEIENQCNHPDQCKFTEGEIEQLLEDCKTAVNELNTTTHPSLELCKTYILSDEEIGTLLNHYLTYLESNPDSIKQLPPTQSSPYVILKQ